MVISGAVFVVTLSESRIRTDGTGRAAVPVISIVPTVIKTAMASVVVMIVMVSMIMMIDRLGAHDP